MAKDATPDSIMLVNDNFANENHEFIAEILEDEWDAQTTFTDLGEQYDAHRATFQKVYNRYFGVSEEQFNDGIEDDRTIDQIKEEFGTYKNYRQLRESGQLGMEPDMKEMTERELEWYQEGERNGFNNGMSVGWNRALEMVEKQGIENVSRMDE